ncbi:hypothetical protein [Anaerofustis stercorihominis]|uniref:hypothetical protein n=1 Tax=Anaerofustis stercorihominis TaxID=214853 RepID=UPI0026736BB0|nr:hypothetical protein [Anaerofustis stercorihominis]
MAKHYVICENKCLEEGYTKKEVYNKEEINEKFSGENLASQFDLVEIEVPLKLPANSGLGSMGHYDVDTNLIPLSLAGFSIFNGRSNKIAITAFTGGRDALGKVSINVAAQNLSSTAEDIIILVTVLCIRK